MKNTEEKIKNRWENRSLVFGIISILSCMCAMPTSGVPLGIPIGIFAIAFAVISAKGGMRGKAVAGIVTGNDWNNDGTDCICHDTFCGSTAKG